MATPVAVPLLKKKKQKSSSGEHSSRVCVVHFEHTRDRVMKPLSERAFHSIKEAKIVRSKSKNELHSLPNICKNIPDMIDRDRHGMHVFCYKNFTNTTHVKAALARVATETVVAHSPYIIRKHLESSASAAAVASTSTCASTSDNVNPNLFPQDSCLFCSKGPTKKQGRYVGLAKCQTSPASRRIKEYAVLKKDFSLVGKVSGFSLAPRVARFHEHCRRNYVAKADRRSRQTSVLNDTVVEETVVDDADDDADNSYLSGTNEHRKAYDEAFKHVCSYIEEDIINKGNAVCMTALREMYLEYIQQHSPLYYNPSHKTQKLKGRILRHFEDRIRFSQSNNKTDLLYSANISTGAAVEAAFELATSESQPWH